MKTQTAVKLMPRKKVILTYIYIYISFLIL